MRRRPSLFAALLGVATVGATAGGGAPSDVAAPWFILFHGEGIDGHIVLSDYPENARFMESLRPTSLTAVEGRLAIDVAMFWGPEWARYSKTPESLAALKPTQASQRGKLYVGTTDSPPALVLGPLVVNRPGLGRVESGGTITPAAVGVGGITVLQGYGIPVFLN